MCYDISPSIEKSNLVCVRSDVRPSFDQLQVLDRRSRIIMLPVVAVVAGLVCFEAATLMASALCAGHSSKRKHRRKKRRRHYYGGAGVGGGGCCAGGGGGCSGG